VKIRIVKEEILFYFFDTNESNFIVATPRGGEPQDLHKEEI
jgi:hypothetical protein